MRIVLATHPIEGAEAFALQLIDEELARCIQIQTGATSIYRWQGRIQKEQEAVLMIKTSERKIADLKTRFLELHPYDVPEFLPLTVDETNGNIAYLNWINNL
ncbi:MAG: divalent-cation tolerance protein CutA [Myxococcota bacterium]|nr:divalent-cation tolerance protein CutA [Myxococcota bacterium]